MKLRVVFIMAGIAASAAELPVRHVVLYKHGVGYFERAGDLAPGESARLDFQASEMNDVLKSLTVEVKGGARVAGLRYDASDPLSHRLEGFSINLGKEQPLSALLDQLKGERLELKLGDRTFAGSIAGARLTAATSGQPSRELVTLLLDSGDMATLELSAASSVRLTEPKLQGQLKEYMTVLAQARSKDKRSVYIDSSDAGRRAIAVRYMIPAPVWKSSYRMILADAGDPTLEGWGIVDNTTGDDWTQVRLALVSGKPISFRTSLYEPKYVERPEAELAEGRAQKPAVHTGGVIGGIAGGVPGGVPAGAPGGVRRDARMMAAPPSSLRESFDEVRSSVAESTIEATAQGGEIGELFEYRFTDPVTVQRGQSAMLPFLQQKIGGRKLLIYADPSSPHPLNAAEITNTSGKTLDGGPITVFDGGAYAGEALMETLKAGDKRLISYGIDLGTRIATEFDFDRSQIREIRASRGVLTTRTAIQETRVFTIRNVDQKAKTLIVEHPLRTGFRLLNQKPSETTRTAWRFEVKLGPAVTEKFPITEEHLLSQTYALASQTPEQLLAYIENKQLSDEGRKQLQQIADRKRQFAEARRQTQVSETEINEIVRDQERIRQNLQSLNRVSGQQEQVQRYAKQLADQEVGLAALRDRVSDLRKKAAALESELNAMIEKLEF